MKTKNNLFSEENVTQNPHPAGEPSLHFAFDSARIFLFNGLLNDLLMHEVYLEGGKRKQLDGSESTICVHAIPMTIANNICNR